MEIKRLVAGLSGRSARLEFTTTLATALAKSEPGTQRLEVSQIPAGLGGRTLLLEFNEELATAFVMSQHPFLGHRCAVVSSKPSGALEYAAVVAVLAGDRRTARAGGFRRFT